MTWTRTSPDQGRRGKSARASAADALWQGERRPGVVIAVRLRTEAGRPLETQAHELLMLRKAVEARLAAIGARHLDELALRVTASISGTPGGRTPPVMAGEAATALLEAHGHRVSIAVEPGELIVMRGADRVVWSDAVSIATSRADATPAGQVYLGADRADWRITDDLWLADAELERLEPLSRAIVKALAVLEEPLELRELAALLGIAQRTATAALRRLERAGLVDHDPHGSGVTVPKGPLAAAAAARVLADDRLRLHRALANCLAGDSTASRLRISRHLARAGATGEAVDRLRDHAREAISSRRASEALPALDALLALIEDAGETIAAATRLDVVRQAATAIGVLRGNAAPEVAELCRKGIAIVESMSPNLRDEAAPTLFECLWSLQAHDLVAGEIAQALVTGERVKRLAQRIGRRDLERVAFRLFALTAFMAGDLAHSRSCYERTLALPLDDVVTNRSRPVSFATDQIAAALAGLSWVEAVAGRIEVSNRHAREAARRAAALGHPHTEAHVAGLLAARALMLDEASAALPLAQRAHRLALSHGFAYWEPWSAMIIGAADDTLSPSLAASRVRAALDRYVATGARQAIPFGAVLLAQLHLAAGEEQQAATTIERALPLVATGRVALLRAPVWGMRARVEAVLARRHNPSARRDPRVRKLAAEAYHEARRIGSDLLAGQAAATLMLIETGGDVTPWRTMTHKLLA